MSKLLEIVTSMMEFFHIADDPQIKLILKILRKK